MSASRRMAEGGTAVDRRRPVAFRFDGRRFEGLAGDTLASALLANGVRVVARSFKYHRPRGIVALGAEEPGARVRVLAPAAEPLACATTLPIVEGLEARAVNCWPSLRFDAGALIGAFARLLPAGFYYKTFMAPALAWPFYERVLRRLAGLGVVDAGAAAATTGATPGDDECRGAGAPPAPPRKRRRYAHADVLVVGAGAAGMAAALVAARSGARVILADERARPGGALHDAPGGADALAWISAAAAAFDALPGTRRLVSTQVFGYHDHGFLTALERGAVGDDCVWKIRARRVVLATGAHERPMVFPDNDRPGVMLASAVTGYLHRYGVACGRRALLACCDDAAWDAAIGWAQQGIEVVAIADARREVDPVRLEQARALGIRTLVGHRVEGVDGRRAVRGARLAAGDGASTVRLACDLIAMAGGWSPTVHLHSQSAGKVVYDADRACFVPGTAAQPSRCAGAAAGRFETAACLADGLEAGAEAAAALGLAACTVAPPELPIVRTARAAGGWAPAGAGRGTAFVDLANDVTVDDLALAHREGYGAVELAKRYTTAGMGVDQGKTANVNAIGVLAELAQASPGAIGTTTFRPPYAPVAFGAIAGLDPGPLVRPVRRTPMTHWHEARGAVMYESGANWRRPGYYPEPGESMADAVARECRAVRERAGIYDSSPLGKFAVRGPGAGAFLDFVCTGAVADLKPGRGRYNLMLREDGRLLDDGVVFRLSDDQFWVSTTAGNADAVHAWLEFARQCLWRGAPVFIIAVTAQWANAVVCGPHARAVLAAAGTDFDLARESFPFMAMREGQVGGLAARVFRVSFTGELSFEVNVPARHGAALWTALIDAGAAFGIEPVGSEANHVLRVEKGYLSIGHEADGMATPDDLGLAWAVDGRKADFIGKRALARSASHAGARRQLVGLLPADAGTVLAEGAQILASDGVSSVGFVTASVASGALGRSIALALLDDGRRRLDETVRVTVESATGLGSVAARVVAPAFYDVRGERLRG